MKPTRQSRGRCVAWLLIAGALAVPALLTWAAHVAEADAGDEMAAIGPAAPVVVDAEFDAGVHITQATTGYIGYRAWLEWDPSVVAYVDPPGVTYTGLGVMVFDVTPVVLVDGVQFASARMTGTSNATGKAADVRLKCIAPGTSPLHLVTLVEDATSGTTQVAPYEVIIPTTLVDGGVTCGASTPTPTATSTPTRPPSVGGIAALPPSSDSLGAETGVAPDGSGSSAALSGAIGGGAALLVAMLGGAGWYARRRRLR